MSELPEEPTIWGKLNDFCLNLSLIILAASYVIALGVMLGTSLLLLFRN